MRPRLLQVCNVGQICGGTAACAWTVTRALPGFEHVVAFLGPIAAETRAAFAPHRVCQWPCVSPEWVATVRPDVLLLHNTSAARVHGRAPVPTLMYLHSRIRPTAADVTVCCSRWLAERMGMSPDDVLWQAVPQARHREGLATFQIQGQDAGLRGVDDGLVIGRICTPQAKKWPALLVPFYRCLAERFPTVRWEFVGCPLDLQAALALACGGRVRYWTAGWDRRSLLTTWDALLHHQPDLPESFGRTVAEGMRVGCVPIVDAQGGFVEQLDAGGGFLCREVEDFSAAIDALQSPQRLRDVARTATGLANERWSLDRFARNLLAGFDAAAHRGAGGRQSPR